MKPALPALLLALVVAGCGPAEPEAAGGAIEIVDARARETAEGTMTGAVYLEIRNPGAADRLLSVETPAAGMAHLHGSFEENGIARMRPVAALDIPAGGKAVLEPGGLHIMLMDLDGRLVAGTRLPLTLRFERAGALEIEADIRAVDAF